MNRSEIENILGKLTEANGAPGFEDEVRDLIISLIKNYVNEIKVDKLGNLIATKGEGEPKIMISAHMDEVALMVRYIENNGFIRFINVGGLSPYVLLGKEVIIYANNGKKYYGVIGAKPPHVTKGVKELNIEDLYIDLGATSKKEVEECGIEIGDYAFFTSKFRISKQNIIGKAFDDRIGCFLLIKLLKEIEDFKGTIYATFTVQEEVGLRGAGVAAFSIEPDVAIVLEGTVASDTPDTPPYKAITFLNKGPAIRVLDATMITHRKLLKFVKNIAREKGIPYQLQISPRSGTDAGRIHITKSGIPSVVISVPCRYIHSPHCIAKINDLENTFKLLLEVSKRMNEFTTEL